MPSEVHASSASIITFRLSKHMTACVLDIFFNIPMPLKVVNTAHSTLQVTDELNPSPCSVDPLWPHPEGASAQSHQSPPGLHQRVERTHSVCT